MKIWLLVNSLVLGWLLVRSVIHGATLNRLWARADKMSVEVRASMAGKLLEPDTSLVRGATDTLATPPPIETAYERHLKEQGKKTFSS